MEMVPDELWVILAPLLPPPPSHAKGGRPRMPNRAALTGMLFVLRTGCPWSYLPIEMGWGSGSTCWRRLRDRQAAGVWQRLERQLLNCLGDADQIFWRWAGVDSTSVPAERGTRRPDRIRRIAARRARSAIWWSTATAAPSRRSSRRRTTLVRRYARAAGGARAVGSVPAGHWTQLTILGALSLTGLGACMLVNAPTDTDIFTAYVRHLLVPTLRPGQVVVLDNLSAHRAAAVRTLIEGAGCRLLFLPPYSPDFKLIEPAWSKLKALLRDAAARTREVLEAALTRFLDPITASDAQGWFAHAGYDTANGGSNRSRSHLERMGAELDIRRG